MKIILSITAFIIVVGGGILLWPSLSTYQTSEKPEPKISRYISPYVETPHETSPSVNPTAEETPIPPPYRKPRRVRPSDNRSAENYRIDPEPDYDRKKLEKMIHREVNRQRELAGLKKLKYDKEIASVARKYSRELAAEAQEKLERGEKLTLIPLRHEGKTFGKTHIDRLYSKEIYNFNRAGENIFSAPLVRELIFDADNNDKIVHKTWFEPEEVVYDSVIRWMLSPGHKKNILTPEYTRTGVGVVRVGDFVIATQLFIEEVDCGYLEGDCCAEEENPDKLYCFKNYSCVKQRDGEMKCEEPSEE